MSYTTNEYLNFVSVAQMFSSEECDSLIKMFAGNWKSGVTVGSRITGETDNIRVVDIAMNELPKLITSKIFQKILEANSKFYNFKLTDFRPHDPPLIFKYSSDNQSHYDWHNDFGPTNTSTRKLSFSIILSDPAEFQGGDLEFLPSFGKGNIQKGSIVIFPAYLTHRVTPVTAGTRYCIVGWVHGEAFR